MPTPDQTRIELDRARPRILELWWALRPLTSVIRFMQSGAHPDDEMSGMLAALAFRDGVNLSYACSTRGEGGQNDIGTEAGADLGALRTREMERACDILGMRMYWLSENPEDPITDFGFSKSGVETLGKWGHTRTLARFVEIVRTERPDILCPTFLDVPGQHGHHRAMTQAAHEVMAAAADPGFPSNLPPWQVRKLYLPAKSGAGQAYDDSEPPPPATLVVDGSGHDPMSGWAWDRLGQQSRAFHRTQGMGRWIGLAGSGDWPLHLAKSHVEGPDTALASGLPATVGDLAGLPGAGPIADALATAQASIDAAITGFPYYSAVAAAALRALEAIRSARAGCPEEAQDEFLHRLDAKEVQLGHVIRLALGVEAQGRSGEAFLLPGQTTPFTVELEKGRADTVDLDCVLPEGWSVSDGMLSIPADARPSDPYRSAYDPAAPTAPALRLRISAGGHRVETRLPFDMEPIILPERVVSVSPEAALVNLSGTDRSLTVTFRNLRPADASLDIAMPPDWSVAFEDGSARLTLPDDVATGMYHLPVRLDGRDASDLRRIEHAHVAPTARARPAGIRLRVLDVAVPDVRVGYIGAGNDRVDHWLSALGADVTAIGDEELQSDSALAGFGTIVIGIFAMRFRPGLVEAMPRLHRWVEAGGTLVTLYHRPWDNWDPDVIPPRRLEIGQPSLRWRVTDETAGVRHLADHPVLQTPNRIGPEDWKGWVKERGLYFAKSWDESYVPLLEMADADEAPHRGALLVADIGKGRHVHTSLILHHQMENLVPGAFRLMANLIAPRK
ncbi:PIG-L family deacetylase [Tropicimonas sp. IMCC6043]|uniref:PIG-L family deacetylase n=1 Tax=Tropicimonas sp. IMCC6043 TaxID=2510645 RepID=UPI00101D602D|nr:PIG-L family deacetylase [Tropicimonas sp. IMCC6043]RYH11284.1 PIG-L family deacetylase [Tropicimonas sp. IMCC6043]